jgi:molecular chaperone GrpE
MKKKEENKCNEDIKKQLNEYKDILQRLQAEFENYRKRTEKEREELTKYGNKELIVKLLPVVDNFELAFNNQKDKENFIKGIELIYAQFNEILEKEGVQKIKVLGEKFNPELHEALLQETSDKPEGTVTEELQSGYKFHDKVIRFAKVKVSKGGKK